MYKKGFTLVEIITALAVIGVVAALFTSVFLINGRQHEFKTGLKKAVSVLNNAISMNMAIGRRSPYENKDLYGYLAQEMNIIKEGAVNYTYFTETPEGLIEGKNKAFYTLDGMRFEFGTTADKRENGNRLHESDVTPCTAIVADGSEDEITKEKCNGCGSYGLSINTRNTDKPPCLIMVDVNGDKKPTPGNVDCHNETCAKQENIYKVPSPGEKRITDIFAILITEDRAIPYGVAAQRAMYNNNKNYK